MFHSYFKKRIIKKYARKLPQNLKAKYGYRKHYSQEQVDASIKDTNIKAHSHYAYAMFCSSDDYRKISENSNGDLGYDSMRTDISDTLFNGVPVFSFSTLLVESHNSWLGGLGDTRLGNSESGDGSIGSDIGGDGGE